MANSVTLAFASATLTVAANPAAAETVVVGGQTYTFVAAAAAANDVVIGADAEESIDNLVAAINGAGGDGYHAATVRNKRCWAEKASASTLEAYAQVPGDIGNAVAVSETLAAVGSAWDAANLAGGSGNLLLWIETLLAENQVNAEVLSELHRLTPYTD